MKKLYRSPELEIIFIRSCDILSTSKDPFDQWDDEYTKDY